MNEAKCAWTNGVGPGFMYGETGTEAERAKQLCWGTRDGEQCPLMAECLAQATVDNEIYGVWGGCGQRERVKIRANWKATGRIEHLPGMAKKYAPKRSIAFAVAS